MEEFIADQDVDANSDTNDSEENNVYDVNIESVNTSKYLNTMIYVAARIKRDHPEIQKKMEAGEFKSIRQAALAAGIIQPTVAVPLNPNAAARCIIHSPRPNW